MRIFHAFALAGILWGASRANAAMFTYSDPVGDLLDIAVEPLFDVTGITLDVTASTLTITMAFTSPAQLERIGGALEFDTDPHAGWPSMREDYGYDPLEGRDYSLWFYPGSDQSELIWIAPDFTEHTVAVLQRTISGNSVTVAIPLGTTTPDTGLLIDAEFWFSGMIGHDQGMTELIPDEGWYHVPVPEPAFGFAGMAAACLIRPKSRRPRRPL